MEDHPSSELELKRPFSQVQVASAAAPKQGKEGGTGASFLALKAASRFRVGSGALFSEIESAASGYFRGLVDRYAPFVRVCAWLLLLGTYLGLIQLQLTPERMYQVKEAVQIAITKGVEPAALLEDRTPLDGHDGPLTWLMGSVVKPSWRDPVCGDGICEAPYEEPSYGNDRFGCRADCGVAKDAVSTLVRVTSDFRHPALAQDQLREVATWNLCRVDEDRLGAGYDDLCLFPDGGVPFPSEGSGTSEATTLIAGQWYLRVDGDPAGRTAGLLLDGSVADSQGVLAARDAAENGTLGTRVVLNASDSWGYCETPKRTFRSAVPIPSTPSGGGARL
ncbi:DUF5011 domain-containing protein [Pycnococcus provasolii]